MMTNLCIRCGQSPAVRAWMYCEACWRIIIGLPEPSPAEPKAASPNPPLPGSGRAPEALQRPRRGERAPSLLGRHAHPAS